ncbi:MAG: calcium-binding protein [Cyanobacteria bacterium J06634_6]
MEGTQSFLMIPDSVSDRILLFDPIDGSLVNDNFIDGSADTGLGIFGTPINAVQVDQEIWISDQVSDAIFRFDLKGSYLGMVGDSDTDGDTDGLDNIRGMEFVNGLVYVANGGDDNEAPGDGEVVVVFDAEGNNLGFFDTGDPYDIRAYNGELLISDINRDSDGGEDIDRYTIDGINSTLIGTFHESDGETGVDFAQQITLRESSGTVLVGGFSAPGGIYEYDTSGAQVGFLGAEEGFANRLRAAYELGNGNIIWSGGDGVIVTNPETGEDADVTYTVDNLEFRPSARYIEPLIVLPEGDRDLTGALYVADQTLDSLLLAQDLNGDGDANNPLEASVFFDGTNASGLVDPTTNIFTVLQASDGSVLYGDGGTDTVYRLTDTNRDGDALDEGEASVWFSADNAEGLPLLTPNGLAEGADGAIYVTEADTRGTPNGDFIYRTEDLNGDGDANDAGEASVWLDLKAVNANSSPFEITFIDNTAYIIDSVGTDTNVIYRAEDTDGSGTVETDEVSMLVDETTVPVDFGLTTDGQSLFTVELLDFEGPQSIFKIEDGESVTTTEVWNSTAVPEGYVSSVAFSIAAGPNGELAVTSNGGDPNEDNVFRLVDANGDGDYFDAGETIPYLSNLLTSTVPVRARVVEYAQNPDAGIQFDVVGTNEAETLVGDDENNNIDALGGNDTVAGGLGDDLILGGDGDDVLRGDRNARSTQDGELGGNDIIFGGDGNDRIGGKAGNDILSGDAGDDFIWGDDGDDIIMGVTGNDTLVGDNFSNGSGSDLFVFGNSDGTDTILDFEVGIDRIGLVEGELLFTDLTLTQDGANTLLGVTSSGETLAILNNVQASALTESSFAVVADVSNPEEALALI